MSNNIQIVLIVIIEVLFIFCKKIMVYSNAHGLRINGVVYEIRTLVYKNNC